MHITHVWGYIFCEALRSVPSRIPLHLPTYRYLREMEGKTYFYGLGLHFAWLTIADTFLVYLNALIICHDIIIVK